MAGRSDNLENLVRQVVNHPSFQDAVNSISSTSSETSPHVNRSESNPAPLEVIPRVSVDNQNSENGSRRTPREEFQSLFRRAGSSFQQSPDLPHFQRRTNWGPSPSSRSRSREKPYSSNSKGKNVKNTGKKTTFTREVVLLRRPCDSMVRGAAKAELQRLGHVLNAFEFDKLWTADEVVKKLEEAFERHLNCIDINVDNKSKFKIMMGIGNELVEPQLTSDQTLTGEMLNRIFTQRTIWLLPCVPLTTYDDDDDDDDEEETEVTEVDEPIYHDYKLGDIRKYTEESEGTSSDTIRTQHQADSLEPLMPPAPTLANQQHGECIPVSSVVEVNSLKEMFPTISTESITQALHKNNGDIQKVVNILLRDNDTADDGESSSDDFLEKCAWDTPLEENFAKTALQKFVEEGLQTFHVDMDVHVKRDTDILTQMIRKYKNPAFDIRKPLNVEFQDQFGVDSGGPTRELFSLLMKRLAKYHSDGLNLFEGLQGHLLPRHDYDLLSGGVFFLLGKMILHSVLNGCCGVAGLSPAVIAYLCTGRRDAAVQYLTLEDFPDPVVKNNFEELLSCNSSKLAEFTLPDSPVCINEELQAAGYALGSE
ncbi:uncharacterized protein LOC114534729 [Dendronephthya gigantea]|uniref:uncharacterized protein LOC114534729 n=1 Tax=Dendronephthya gigantea TaxID=151771 RepID=UPI00106D4701|nr:uncharacterized protein LOC114534729 [Dendronephthya gigantea]